MRWAFLAFLIATAAAVSVVVSGCGAPNRSDVEAVATAFANGGPEARCALLTGSARSTVESDQSGGCADAIDDLAPPAGAIRHLVIWGNQAQVRMDDDTVFLNRTQHGWRVAAAGCTRDGDAPYQCEVDSG